MRAYIDRSIYTIGEADDHVATFFEVVRHRKYGIMRGSGVVIKTDGLTGWKLTS